MEVAEGVIKEPVAEHEKISDKAPEKLIRNERDEILIESDLDSDSGSSAEKGPPETVFQKLGPSENRYTLLHWRDYSGNYRDEL